MIPFERDPGARRDPRRERSADSHGGAWSRGGVDDTLRRTPSIPPTRAARAIDAWAGWLVAPMCLVAVAAAFLFVMRGPDKLFAIAFGVVLALGIAWILACSLFPAQVDRACPRCRRETLTRMQADSAQGLRCSACAWCDPLASSFLLAEEDGAEIENIALRERRRRRRR